MIFFSTKDTGFTGQFVRYVLIFSPSKSGSDNIADKLFTIMININNTQNKNVGIKFSAYLE